MQKIVLFADEFMHNISTTISDVGDFFGITIEIGIEDAVDSADSNYNADLDGKNKK